MSTDNKKMKTDDLIGQLCGELTPTSPRCPYRRVAVWFVASVVYLGFVVWYLGIRPDFQERLHDTLFLYELMLGSALLMSASLASSWLSFPDCMQRNWMKIVPVTLFGSFVLWIVARSIAEGMTPMATLHIGHCAHEGILMEIIPIIALVIITMRGRTTHPYWAMAMNILAVSSLGWIGLRLTCSMDEMGHSFINHLLPFAIIGAGLGFFARKLFKW
ncbi:MAG TPA: NrsF family protein [Alphaproteobacteria bacterium]|nr:NrsF family protein [Alphaproteobacteria bacterium]